MIKIAIDKIPFEVPLHWGELTFSQWIKLKASDGVINNVISIITGLQVEQVNHWGQSFLDQLSPFIGWLSTSIDPSAWTLPNSFMGIDLPIDIKRHTFGQKIELHLLLEKEKDHVSVMDKILSIYFQGNISEQQIRIVFPIAIDLINQLEKIGEIERAELAVKAKDEQLRAGINMFDQFGVMNTVDSLAGGDLLKYDSVLKMDYNTVFSKMARNKLEGVYQDNYRKILEAKK